MLLTLRILREKLYNSYRAWKYFNIAKLGVYSILLISIHFINYYHLVFNIIYYDTQCSPLKLKNKTVFLFEVTLISALWGTYLFLPYILFQLIILFITRNTAHTYVTYVTYENLRDGCRKAYMLGNQMVARVVTNFTKFAVILTLMYLNLFQSTIINLELNSGGRNYSE